MSANITNLPYCVIVSKSETKSFLVIADSDSEAEQKALKYARGNHIEFDDDIDYDICSTVKVGTQSVLNMQKNNKVIKLLEENY